MTVSSIMTNLFGPKRAEVAPGIFLACLLLTPFAFAATGLVALVVGGMFTAVAAVLGLPAFLTVGTLALYVVVTRKVDAFGRPTIAAGVVAGWIANLASAPLAYLVLAIMGERPERVLELAISYALLGLAAAPMQTGIFVALYRWLAEPRPIMRDAHIFN